MAWTSLRPAEKIKGRAFSNVRVEGDGAAMVFNDGLGDAEAEPGTTFLAGTGSISLEELLKDLALGFYRNARPSISHRYAHHRFLLSNGNVDFLPLRRELGRIRDKVRHDLHQPGVVTFNHKVRPIFRRTENK